MKKLLKKKAFTLVELIVAMAVMVILIAAAMGYPFMVL
ncbi:MAG: type II secretion system protein [Muribaculaceae bacterium]|nr:type II secretion system protein [Muribaculaceae bacterium]